MMEPRDCICERCVDDVILKEAVKAGQKIAKCFWCHAKQVRALPLEEMGHEFRKLVEWAYDSEDLGEPLHELLFDERIFSRRLKRQPSEGRRELILALLKAGVQAKELCLYPDYAGRFVPKPSRLVENWVLELERFLTGERQNDVQPVAEHHAHCDDADLPSVEPDLPSEFEVFLEDVSCFLSEGVTFWRARCYERQDKARFGLEDLKAPPPECIKLAGRANRKGESVLYLASDAKTAIAEVRGWQNWPIALAEFRLEKEARIVDTTGLERLYPESPFEEGFRWKAELIALLMQLRSELSRPVSPGEAGATYRPTQRFCELVRRYDYAGLKYPSAMGKGSNLVLFDQSVATPKEVCHLRVAGLAYRVRALDAGEPLFDEQPYNYLLGDAPE